MKKKVLNLLAAIFFIYLILIALMYLMQRNMMYYPTLNKPDIPAAKVTGLHEIRTTTEDGLDLFGWYKPAQEGKQTIVWFHGNGSNVEITTYRALPYLKAGYGLLAVEYRGYASNKGSPSEQGFYKDARAFMAWLNRNEVADDSIILYGESIGSGVAVQMATEHEVHTLILDSPFSSMSDVASSHYPIAPVKWLLLDKYDSYLKIGDIKSPLILVHGTADAIVPYKFGKKLYEAAPQPKTMMSIEGGGHNNLDDFDIAYKIITILSEEKP